MKIIIILVILAAFNVTALTPKAEKGKAVITVCMSCHNPELYPALAPPFYGVQNKYKQKYNNQKDFVEAITHWVKVPSLEKALMQRPVKMLGLMPPMPLPDDMLKSIGSYLYQAEFLPPCTHWANDMSNSESKGQGNGIKKGGGKGRGQGKVNNNGTGNGGNHDAMIRMKYEQLCISQTPK